MYKLLIVGLLTSSALAMNSEIVKINKSAFMAPRSLVDISLIHENNNFFVEKDGIRQPIQKAFTSPLLRTIKPTQLVALHENGGYLKLKQMSDGEYSLDVLARINGGGPVAGQIAYWITKTLCYGTTAAATTAAVVAIGGTAGEAALVTAGVILSTSSIPAVGGTIEGIATLLAGAFTALPFLP
jgi:hypothetical protein